MLKKKIHEYKILVTILTSSKIDFLKECYRSVKNQEISNINYKIVIIVNTLNDDYYIEVMNNINDCKIIRTESNGYPGKGHNSCIQYFKDNKEYDYLIPIDGDDFVYPFFFKNIENYIDYPYNPDVLFLPFSDTITNIYPGNKLHIPHKYCYYTFNLESLELMNNVFEKKSPFKFPLENVNTPGRLILLSKKILDLDIRYQENLKWYDDLLIFLQIFEYHTIYPNKFKIFFLEDYHLHIYNRINEDSVSNNFEKEGEKLKNYITENKYFKEEIKNKFLSIRTWRLDSIPILHNPNKELLEFKIRFVKDLLSNLKIKESKLIYNKNILDSFRNYLIKNKYEHTINFREIENNCCEK